MMRVLDQLPPAGPLLGWSPKPGPCPDPESDLNLLHRRFDGRPLSHGGLLVLSLSALSWAGPSSVETSPPLVYYCPWLPSGQGPELPSPHFCEATAPQLWSTASPSAMTTTPVTCKPQSPGAPRSPSIASELPASLGDKRSLSGEILSLGTTASASHQDKSILVSLAEATGLEPGGLGMGSLWPLPLLVSPRPLQPPSAHQGQVWASGLKMT